MNYCINVPQTVLKKADRIIVIGDIHGDYKALIKILYYAKIIDKRKQWIAFNTHVVQLGDILDRGGRIYNYGDEQSEYKILKLLFKLMKYSKRYNSGLHIILGNHEIMNVMGDFSYVSPLGMQDFNNNRYNMLKPGGTIAKQLACNTNSILKIGNWLFSHAGVLPSIAEKYKNIEEVNSIIRNFLLGNTELHNDNDIFNLFTHRKYGQTVKCSNVKKALDLYDSKYQVVGHTIQKNGINAVCDDSLYRIDVGLSNAFGIKRRLEFLEILNDTEVIRHKIHYKLNS